MLHSFLLGPSLCPRWDWLQVTEELVESYFEPLPEGEELQLDDVSQLDVSWSPPSKL